VTAREDRLTVSLIAVIVAAGAFALGLIAIIFGGDGDAQADPAAATESVTTVPVTLTEFAIEPAHISVPAGPARLQLINAGTAVHNFSVPELDLLSPDIQPGEEVMLDLGTAAAGDYEVLCEIAGHASSGMTGMLMVGATGTTTASGTADAGQETMSNEEMDALMEEVANQFPAETEGHGGEPIEPTVLADGTKQFDLVAEIVDWEVEPGRTVEAWTYNGVVPAPEIKVDVGDKVRIVLQNDLPESTTLHFHGVRVPNAADGVDPYTQPPIKPGASFTYEFTAVEPAVGMYHSHHNAQVQVPNGLAGAFLIGEMPIPEELGVQTVKQTINMVLNDAGTLGLSLNGKSFPATEPYSLKVGESIVVHYFNEGLMAHPMHLHQPTGWVIAKDGVPLAEPFPSDTVNVAPGERWTVVYTAHDPGVWAWHCHILNHAETPTGMRYMVTALIVEE
jgi:FtsP/CotA-like multicopper oxidase with cupredoxin domain